MAHIIFSAKYESLNKFRIKNKRYEVLNKSFYLMLGLQTI
jgi:hypothetical protein